jgi:hypothetical protein
VILTVLGSTPPLVFNKKFSAQKVKKNFAKPLFILSNTPTMHIKSFYIQRHCYVSLKPFTLAGFEPGSLKSKSFRERKK